MLGIGLVVGIIVGCALKDSGQSAAGKKEAIFSRNLSELKLSRDADDALERVTKRDCTERCKVAEEKDGQATGR